MFTRQHYKVIAEIIKQNQPQSECENDYCTGKSDAMTCTSQELADYFVADNPQFDRQKFLAACEAD